MTATVPTFAGSDNEDWRHSALCAQTDPELFFPEIGEPAREAKRVCAVCPVSTECLADAMRWISSEDRSSIRGGLSAKQREQLRKRSP